MEERLDPSKASIVSSGKKRITMPQVKPRQFFRQCVELLQPILKLRNREADVLAELLYHSYDKREIKNVQDKAELVFNTSTRRKIQEQLKISNPVIQQALGGLRKKGVIKGIHIREFFTIEPQAGVFELTFNFVVTENASQDINV